MNMKLRYRLFLRRKSVYYAFDDTTKTFTSLKTRDKAEANRLLMAMNEAGTQPAMNLSLARVYLRHSDPLVSTRTWKNVLDEIIALKTGPTQARWKTAAKDKAFDLIRDRLIQRGATDGFVTDFGEILSLFFRDPDGLEGEVCVANPDAAPGVVNPPGTPAKGYTRVP